VSDGDAGGKGSKALNWIGKEYSLGAHAYYSKSPNNHNNLSIF